MHSLRLLHEWFERHGSYSRVIRLFSHACSLLYSLRIAGRNKRSTSPPNSGAQIATVYARGVALVGRQEVVVEVAATGRVAAVYGQAGRQQRVG